MNLRAWLAVGVFAAAWLPGLGYYGPANVWAGGLLVLVGVGLLAGRKLPLPDGRDGTIALVLLLPAVWFVPWPQKTAAALLAAGLALAVAPIPRGWPRRVAPTTIVAGSVLLAQSVAVYLYAVLTARSHDLPWPLASLAGGVVRLLGAEAVTAGSTLALRGTTTVHPLAATWDALLPPTVVGFVVGGAVMLAFASAGAPRRKTDWLRAAGLLLLVVLAWLPIRWALLIGLYTQRVAMADSSAPLCVMNQFLAWWLPAVLLAGPVLLAWWFVPLRISSGTKEEASEDVNGFTTRRRLTVVGLVALGAALLAIVWAWDPIGNPKQGRIRIVERHSRWEPTDAPYDESSYGEKASYTYRVIYDYASHFFTMSRLDRSTPISAESLDECDVLVLKTPTSRLAKEEVDAIERFVRHGGSLLMVGDHTNVFRSSTFLNDVARRFGFTFRNDLLFRVGDAYEQPFAPAAVPHPAVMHVDQLDLAVSCSIDPGWSCGRTATGGTGLWSLQAEYENENYHPPAEYRPEMRVGPFVQLWATRFGKGRVLAFTDSTIFSNFCIFQPGKAELMLNMLAWLNHGSPFDSRLTWLSLVVPLALVGLILVVVGAWMARKLPGGWLLVLAAAMFGAAVCSAAVTARARAAMPLPDVQQPLFRFVLDRNVSDVPLSKGAYIQGDGRGYGLLEQWITRLGYFTARRQGDDVFDADVLVAICPTGSISDEYRDRVVDFVRQGGRLLVLDAPSNVHSTANRLLWPFGLSMQIGRPFRGPLSTSSGASGVEVDEAWAVAGGTPIAGVGQTAAAARVAFGKGTVTAIGFASAFDDTAMGREWLQEPDEALRRRYAVLYSLLRDAAQGDRPATESSQP
ncbi:MAG: hypothetical protein JW888_05330 [Pirellulales bacterium]|nr:hypothetical protein [Pirellulales bacterium]